MQINQCVIFCGGRGERLRPLTEHIPKPLIPVRGVPFLNYLLYTLQQAGIKKVLFLLGYKGYVVIDHYQFTMGNKFLSFSVGTEDEQTGRRLLNAYDMLDEHFLLCYGDNYLPKIPLEDMKLLYQQRNVSIQTTVFDNRMGTGEYGKENNICVRNTCALLYDKTRQDPTLNAVDIGYFIVNKKVLDTYSLCKRNFSFEEEILFTYANMGWLSAYDTKQQYYWITDIESLRKFESAVRVNGYKPLEWRK